MLNGVTDRRCYDRVLTVKNSPDAEETKGGFLSLPADPEHLAQSARSCLNVNKNKICIAFGCHHSHPAQIVNSKHLRDRRGGKQWLRTASMVLSNREQVGEMMLAPHQEICASEQSTWNMNMKYWLPDKE